MCLRPYSRAYCGSTARYHISPYDSYQTQQEKKNPTLLIEKSCCHGLGWQTYSAFIGKKGQQALLLTGQPEWDLPSSNTQHWIRKEIRAKGSFMLVAMSGCCQHTRTRGHGTQPRRERAGCHARQSCPRQAGLPVPRPPSRTATALLLKLEPWELV